MSAMSGGEVPGTRSAAIVDPADVRWDQAGLVPAVVQDATSGRVLMVAWMDAEALAATEATGLVHFHSRSRDELWRKGATSGHVLHLRDVALDCDGDTLLIRAAPAGPCCHRGTTSCFDAGPGSAEPAATDTELQGFGWLEELWSTIHARAATRPEGSYTARLVAGGPDLAGRKVAEEAVEVLIAAKNDASPRGSSTETRQALAGEAADLLYHLLVVLAERDVPPATVIGELRERHLP